MLFLACLLLGRTVRAAIILRDGSFSPRPRFSHQLQRWLTECLENGPIIPSRPLPLPILPYTPITHISGTVFRWKSRRKQRYLWSGSTLDLCSLQHRIPGLGEHRQLAVVSEIWEFMALLHWFNYYYGENGSMVTYNSTP